MRKLKSILPLALIALVVTISLTSCEKREDWRFPELGNGGFVKFVQQPDTWRGSDVSDGTSIVKYHIGTDPAESSFSAFIEDPNGNVASIEYFVIGDFTGAPADPIPFRATQSFPFEMSFTTADMAALFNVDATVFETGDFFEFISVITTTDGRTYISRVTECEECPIEPGEPAVWNGGTIDAVLLQGGDTGDNFLLPAVWYRVKYLAP